MLTSRSRLAWAWVPFECPALAPPLVPPMPPVAKSTPPATTITMAMAPMASSHGFVEAIWLQRPPRDPGGGPVSRPWRRRRHGEQPFTWRTGRVEWSAAEP